jgi:hypothetical protein
MPVYSKHLALLLANGSMSSNTNNEGEIRKHLILGDAREYGSGFSVSGLQYMRALYLECLEFLPIQHAPRVESKRADETEKQRALRVKSPRGNLTEDNETLLEMAIITKLKDFLLELGTGFAPLSATELLRTFFPGIIAVGIESLRKRIAPQLFGHGQWRLS